MPINGYFDTPFALDGSLTAVPDDIQSNGSVSYAQGYGILYSTPVGSGGFNFPRGQHNQILFDITTAIKVQQEFVIPQFITSVMNGGSDFEYAKGAQVLEGGLIYQSLEDANTDTPPSDKWALIKPYFTIDPEAQTGANYTYAYDDAGVEKRRSNSGTVMADTLPGTGTAVLPAGTSIIVANTDSSAIMTVAAGAGASLDGVATGFAYIAPGDRKTFVSDGSNYWTSSPNGRIRLKAATTIYVATTGSNSNTGLTSAAAFLTLQAALDFATKNIDLNGLTLTIQVADGTYTAGANVTTPFTGGTVLLQGNTTTPANCIISVTSSVGIAAQNQAALNVGGFKITTATSGHAIQASTGGQIYIVGKMDFGSVAGGGLQAHIGIFTGGVVNISANYNITGGAGIHWYGADNGVLNIQGATITLTGTPAFSGNFAQSDANSSLNVLSNTFSGSATGTRYSANLNGVIYTNGGGASYLPGNAAGATSTGGQYA